MAAPRASDDADVQANYATQFALIEALGTSVRSVSLTDWPEYRGNVAALVEEFSSAAVSLAADFYEEIRLREVGAPFRAPTIPIMDAGRVEAYLQATAADMLDTIDTMAAEIERQVEGAAQFLAADSASDELFAAIEADAEARGWARVTRPAACAFCLMLATRGAVYTSESTANFRPHPKCRCSVEPLFGMSYEPPAHIRAAQALWRDTQNLNAFRRALDAERR